MQIAYRDKFVSFSFIPALSREREEEEDGDNKNAVNCLFYLAQSLKGLDIAGVKRQKLFSVTCECIEDICTIKRKK